MQGQGIKILFSNNNQTKRGKMGKTFLAVSALISAIIGAGFLGIPYVVMQSGFKIGLLHLVFIAFILALTVLYLGEIALRTKENHQLTGYAEKYLGKTGKIIMFFAIAFGIYSAILAYLIAEGESLSALLFGNANFSFQISIFFWFALSCIAYFGIKALKEGTSIGVILVFVLLISIFVFFSNKISPENLSYINLNNFFLPFGVIMFAFLAFTAIPEAKIILGEDKKLMKKSIIIAYACALLVYIIFTFIVLGYKGQMTPRIATLALGAPFVLFGMITMFIAYLSLTTSMIDSLKFDFKEPKPRAWLYAISIPILLFILLKVFNSLDFIKILSFAGTISGGLTAVLILLMSEKAKLSGDRKPEYSMPNSRIIRGALIVIFVLCTIAEIF
jgi:amino acid permease